ncbi:MAG: nickel-responsive transcriptional regulator NikR [Candidatus Lernaella stagnicola]|nr:nickel-responsive transcriptional regulator NikR [Candidatus Lernaella stagnicola]
MPKDPVSRIGVSLPPDLLERFDHYIEEKGYETRSKAIADLMREALLREEWGEAHAEVVGAVTLVYDHHTRGLSEKLTSIQHDHHDIVVATTHVHIDHARCLEITVLRGRVEDVREIGERMISSRGVLHGKIVFAATESR